MEVGASGAYLGVRRGVAVVCSRQAQQNVKQKEHCCRIRIRIRADDLSLIRNRSWIRICQGIRIGTITFTWFPLLTFVLVTTLLLLCALMLSWLLLLLLLLRLLLMLATMERMFMEVARKVIWAMLTAAASAAVGHLISRHQHNIATEHNIYCVWKN